MIDLKKIFWIVFSLGFFTNLNAQIVADFVASDTTGCGSLVVNFTDQSVGNNLQYQWDFGNGTTSTDQNPSVLYNQLGSFTVKLVVRKGNTYDTLTKPDYIQVFQNPQVVFSTESPHIGCAPLSINFVCELTQGNAGIKLALWDFGDGNSSTEINPTHEFNGVGDFTVSLYIQDSNSCEGNYLEENYITTTPKPQLAFGASKTITCYDTMTVLFTNSSSGVTDLQYEWDFGDGEESTSQNPQHFYQGFNQYAVQLKVTDDYGCQDSLLKSNFIQMQELNAQIIINDDYLCKYENMSITNNTTGASSYQWIFGDGTSSNLAVPQKSFADTGVINITYVAALANECYDTINTQVFVDRVTANFNTNYDYVCQLPTQIIYTSTSEYAVDWDWHIGMNYNSDHEIAEYILYDTEEIRNDRDFYITDTLVVISEQNCRDTLIKDSNVYVSIPKVYFTPNDTAVYDAFLSGCVPIEVDFENKSYSLNPNDTLVDWSWNFGDENTSEEFSPTHTYNNAGEFDIVLTATSQSGCVNIFDAELIGGTPQTSFFTYEDQDSICGYDKLSFMDESEDAQLINAWVWQFSDGSTSSLQNPEVQFQDTGYMMAKLTVFYNNCMGMSYEKDSVVFVNGPAGGFITQFVCELPYEFNFTSAMEGAKSWVWNFGDEAYDSNSVEQITHIYDTTGDYTITLVALNEESGCELMRDKTVLVRDPKADFSIFPKYNCVGDSIWFNAALSIDAYNFSFEGQSGLYMWNFGDTSDVVLTSDSLAHVFYEPGDYDVNLKIRGVNGCSHDTTMQIHIFSVQPDFSLNDSAGCAPFLVSFNDESTGDTTLASWFWSFGNEGTSDEQSPEFTFNTHGYKKISLTVSDIFGCSSSISKEQNILVSNPLAQFSAPRAHHCFGDTIQMQNNSTFGGTADFTWTFSDGTTSNDENPLHNFPDTGFYNVSLYLMDSLGCDASTTVENYIYVQAIPIVDFDASSQSSICYPKLIEFNDSTESDDLENWIWAFGDNERVENAQNPLHTYLKPGEYDVKLTVVTSLGCTDSLTKPAFVIIHGPYADINLVDSACVNLPIEISMENTTGIDYLKWTTDDGENYEDSAFTKTYQSYGIKRIYLMLQSNSLGFCQKFFADSVIIPQLQANFLVNDTANCIPLQIDITNESIGEQTLKWFLNDSPWDQDYDFQYLFDSAGIFSVKQWIDNEIGCKDSSEQIIQTYPLPTIQISNDTLICQYDSIMLISSGGDEFLWNDSINSQLSLSSAFTVAPEKNKMFYLQLTDSNNCVNYDSVLVQVQPEPLQLLNASDTVNLIVGETFDLQADTQFADEILWEPFELFSCDNCAEVAVLPLKSQYVYFTSTDINGCFEITDSIFFNVAQKFSLAVPTAFSPNNDGVNDELEIKGWGIQKIIELKIFNSKGQLVYQSDEENARWNGQSNLGIQPPGLYIYHVSVLSYDGDQREKQGYFYLTK